MSEFEREPRPGATCLESHQTRPQRLHGLDWLRAGATVLVVALHSGIAYLLVPMPGLVWATTEGPGSPVVDAVAWWIDGFIMPLFFVLGGFVAVDLMRRRGPVGFARHRIKRLLGPFFLGCVLILPLDLYVWLLGWAADGRISLRKLQSLKLEGQLANGIWGVSHLWFLQYLWLFCMGAAVVAGFQEWQRRDHLPSTASDGEATGRPQRFSLLKTRYADDLIAWLLALSAAALWWDPQLVIGFRHSWWPLPANLLFYGPWFAIGWLMAARQPQRKIPRGEWRIVASLVAFALLWPLIHAHLSAPERGTSVLLVTLFVLHAWLAVSGWFGVCLRRLDRRPPTVVRYLAAASFWIYLFHHPVVGLAQIALRQAPLVLEVKFLLTFILGLGLPLLTYEVGVRRTWVGAILNGRSARPAIIPASPEAPESESPIRRRAA